MSYVCSFSFYGSVNRYASNTNDVCFVHINKENNIPSVMTEEFGKPYTSNTIFVILDESYVEEFILEIK